MSRSFSDTEREGGQVPLEGIACAERQESVSLGKNSALF